MMTVWSRTRPDRTTSSASKVPVSSPRERSSVTFTWPSTEPLSATSSDGPVIAPSTSPRTTTGQLADSVPLKVVPSSMMVFFSGAGRGGFFSAMAHAAFHRAGRAGRDGRLAVAGLHHLQAQAAAALEGEPGGRGRLLHGGVQRAAPGDHQRARADDAGALALEELTVHSDLAGAGDLAVGQHARLADDDGRPLPQADRAVLQHPG